jgi:hypothetical protein
MKKTKKVISLLLSVLMIITSIPLMAVNSFATDAIASGDYEYVVLDDGTAKITKYTGSATVLTIPSEIDGYRVTSIYYAFEYRGSLISITIPDSVTSIGVRAFYGCSSLTEINVGSKNANYSSKDGVLFNKNKTEIICYPAGKTATSYSIPDSVTSIGYYAFMDCTSLTSITIPDGVTSIGGYAFEDCTSLTSITIPNSVTSIRTSAFNDCRQLTSVTIPDSVTSIENSAFENCTSLTNITIGKGVTSIGYHAFENCKSLTEINVSSENTYYSSENGVLFDKEKTTLIEYPVAKKDKTYYMPDSVKWIDSFNCPYLESLIIGKGMTMITHAFTDCTSLKSITIPDSVTYIRYGIFDDTAFYNNESNWKDGLLYIGNYLIEAKEDISGNVTIKGGTKLIANGAFFNCTSLKKVIIPDSVTSIGGIAFYGCTSLTSVTIGKGVRTIGGGAFDGCTSLTSITIPDSVSSIGSGVFSDCASLANITMPDSITDIKSWAFYNTAYYNNESNWENGLLYIGDYLIEAKKDISGSVTIKGGTKLIADSAFSECDLLAGISIPEGVTSIGGIAFYGCTSLTNVSIPNSVTSIGDDAFWGCPNLKTVRIPDTVTVIGEFAFGYYETDFEDYAKIEGFTIYGVSGSEAERYANENGFAFEGKLFPDVANEAWYYNAIAFNVNKGYLKGYGNGTFGPADNIQRQDFVVILSRIAGADLSSYSGRNGGFADVPKNDYYSAAVAWAKDNNILSGYANGKFGVGDPITREQACKIFYNYCNGSVSGNTSAILANYPDGGNVSDWARDYVAWAAESHVVGGNGTLNPAGNANRAEMAQIIMNMSNNDIL